MSQRCESCGTSLHTVGDESDCPVCLLKAGLEPSASEQAMGASDSQVTADFLPSTPIKLQPGDDFGKYEIVRRVGRGGMGTVYEAIQSETGRRVALKVLTKSHESAEARARFLREGRLAASVNHPNSVYVFGTEQVNDTPAISMEFVSGGTLYDQVKTSGPLKVSAAVDAILQVIDGLEAAEKKGVLHRDVKPSNCFVDERGEVKVGDYGLSISTISLGEQDLTNVTREGTFLGTPAFSSPEQLRGEDLDGRSDIYSIGATLFYLLTGKTPFTNSNIVQLVATVLDTPPPSVSENRPEVPNALSDAVTKCLAKSPGQRFRNYAELRDALAPFSTLQTPQPGLMGLRCLAAIIDSTVVWCLFAPLSLAVHASIVMTFAGLWRWSTFCVYVATAVVYFAGCESYFGGGVGKRFVRLRVVKNGANASFVSCAIRTLVYVVPALIPRWIGDAVAVSATEGLDVDSDNRWIGLYFAPMLLGAVGHLLVRCATFAKANSSNGYAGFHELATGTRVVSVAREEVAAMAPLSEENAIIGDCQMLGPYHLLEELSVNGAAPLDVEDRLRDELPNGRLWSAFDAQLLRRVWVHQHENDCEPIPVENREIGRVTRLRWLAGQRTEEVAWDCYEAIRGAAITDRTVGEMPWKVRRSLLNDLTLELTEAQKDGSLPHELSIANLWVTDDKRLKLLPFPAPLDDQRNQRDDNVTVPIGHDVEKACIEFLSAVSSLLCIGRKSTLTANSISSVPLSARESFALVNESATWNDALEHVRRVPSPTLSGHARRLGLTAVYVVIPMMLVLLTVVQWLDWQRMDYMHPEIARLGNLGKLAETMSARGLPDSEIEKVEFLMAAEYREIYDNRRVWNSNYTQAHVGPPFVRNVEAAMQTPVPDDVTPQQIADAKSNVERILEDLKKGSNGAHVAVEVKTTTLDPVSAFTFYTPLFLIVFWIPSLLSAAVLERGLMLRMFGLKVVDERGLLASRWRVVFRVLIQGVLVVPLFIVWGYTRSHHDPLMTQVTGVALAIGLGGLVYVSVRHPYRNFSDRIAGTYLAIE